MEGHLEVGVHIVVVQILEIVLCILMHIHIQHLEHLLIPHHQPHSVHVSPFSLPLNHDALLGLSKDLSS